MKKSKKKAQKSWRKKKMNSHRGPPSRPQISRQEEFGQLVPQTHKTIQNGALEFQWGDPLDAVIAASTPMHAQPKWAAQVPLFCSTAAASHNLGGADLRIPQFCGGDRDDHDTHQLFPEVSGDAHPVQIQRKLARCPSAVVPKNRSFSLTVSYSKTKELFLYIDGGERGQCGFAREWWRRQAFAGVADGLDSPSLRHACRADVDHGHRGSTHRGRKDGDEDGRLPKNRIASDDSQRTGSPSSPIRQETKFCFLLGLPERACCRQHELRLGDCAQRRAGGRRKFLCRRADGCVLYWVGRRSTSVCGSSQQEVEGALPSVEDAFFGRGSGTEARFSGRDACEHLPPERGQARRAVW